MSLAIGRYCYLKQEFITRDISLIIGSTKFKSFIDFVKSNPFWPNFVRIYSILSRSKISESKQKLSAFEKFVLPLQRIAISSENGTKSVSNNKSWVHKLLLQEPAFLLKPCLSPTYSSQIHGGLISSLYF